MATKPFITTAGINDDSFFRRPFKGFPRPRFNYSRRRRSSSVAKLAEIAHPAILLPKIEENQRSILPAIVPSIKVPRSKSDPGADQRSERARTWTPKAEKERFTVTYTLPAVNGIVERRGNHQGLQVSMTRSPVLSRVRPVEESKFEEEDVLLEKEGEPAAVPHTSLSLGPALWLHRFLYKTKLQTAESKRLKELAIQKVASKEDKLMTQSQEGTIIHSGARPLDRTVSWGNLRTKLINAKMTEAFSNAKFMVKGERYTALKCLGEGGYSRVYEVFNKDKQLFALKVVNLTGINEGLQQDLLKEITYLERFKGLDHVIQLLEYEHVVNEKENVLYLLLERGECDLETILTRLGNNESLTPAKLRFYWEQMLEAVQTIHSKRIVHADLKPANFVLVRGCLKVIDFGLAGELSPGDETLARKFVGGTREYMSPESVGCYVVEEGAFDLAAMKQKEAVLRVGFKSDIWALGVILYQLVYNGIAPFSSVPGGRLGKLKAMLSPDVPVDFEPVEDAFLMQTMKLCLEKDPDQRATLEQLLKHRFLRPINCLTDDEIASD